MKNILTLLLFACFVFSCLQKVSKQDENFGFDVSEEFVQGSEDIPLLKTMEKISNDSLGFDSNSGSVVNSSYSSKISSRKVREFYLKILPKMGWNMKKNSGDFLEFKRENEKLEIEFESKTSGNMVKFFISSGI